MAYHVGSRAYALHLPIASQPNEDPEKLVRLVNLYLFVTRQLLIDASQEKIAEIYKNAIYFLAHQQEELVTKQAILLYDEALGKKVWQDFPECQKIAMEALGLK